MRPRAISCMCLTFGRVHLLEEAVQSFLLQDFEGDKELLILNDHPAQRLRFDHPQVRVVNAGERFRTVGEKRNAAVSLCSYNVIAVWDDDDISLPHRLSYSARYLDGARCYQAPHVLRIKAGHVQLLTVPWAHSTAVWERSLFRVAGGYPHIDANEDQRLHDRFRRMLGTRYVGMPVDQVFYVYRIHDTESYNVSGRRRSGRIYGEIGRWVDDQIGRGRYPSGDVELQPRWSRDWSQFVKEAVAAQAHADAGDPQPASTP